MNACIRLELVVLLLCSSIVVVVQCSVRTDSIIYEMGPEEKSSPNWSVCLGRWLSGCDPGLVVSPFKRLLHALYSWITERKDRAPHERRCQFKQSL